LLGTPGTNQTEKPLRLIGYQVNGINYWVATNRFDLSAEQIALVYNLNFAPESKKYLKNHLGFLLLKGFNTIKSKTGGYPDG